MSAWVVVDERADCSRYWRGEVSRRLSPVWTPWQHEALIFPSASAARLQASFWPSLAGWRIRKLKPRCERTSA